MRQIGSASGSATGGDLAMEANPPTVGTITTRRPSMKRMRFMLLLLVALALVATACTSDSDDTTTTAAGGDETTTTAAGGEETTTTAAAATTTVAPDTGGGESVTIKFWSTETQPARLEKTQAIIEGFTAATGINVQLTATDENALPQLMLTNAASGTLPDVVFHPLDFTIGWANAGLLDIDAANEVVESLGADTFSAGARSMVTIDGKVAAVPSDGWGQLLIYRKDLFDAAGLEKPDTFAKIQAAAEALNDPGNNLFGITASNDPNAVFTQQTWEHFALANGCQLVDAGGAVTLDTPNCVEAIDFYTNLLGNYAPAGLQDVVSTRATYFAGQAAMIVWSPFIMDEMAGLRDAALPTCEQCVDNISYLAENSDFVPAFAGPSGAPAQYGQVSYMGIGMTDKTDAAKQFVEYWLSDGYIDWLSVAPEGKFPMRQGTADNPTEYIEGWRLLETGVDRRAPLSDYYGEEVINGLITGSDSFARWGFEQGQGELVGAVYSTLIVPEILDEVFAGMSPEDGAAEMQLLAEEEQELLADEG
jgi:multiple sugar transport system substrate-binding protein